jgi:hypothetical protein
MARRRQGELIQDSEDIQEGESFRDGEDFQALAALR